MVYFIKVYHKPKPLKISSLFMVNMEEIYKKLFDEFLSGAVEEESKSRYNSAISNYYKALSTLVR